MLLQMIDLINNPILLLIYIILLIIPLLFSIAFHEFAHGYIAYKFGDITPQIMGRLTLNPFKHLDILGTILLFTIGLGWAKPVIINLRNIPNPTKQMLVALAGPLANILLAVIFALFIKIGKSFYNFENQSFIFSLFDQVVNINMILALFNLIPIPPLDGSRIITWLLPSKLKILYNKFEQYGMFILLLLLFTIGFSWLFKVASIFKNYLYILLEIL